MGCHSAFIWLDCLSAIADRQRVAEEGDAERCLTLAPSANFAVSPGITAIQIRAWVNANSRAATTTESWVPPAPSGPAVQR